MQHLRISWLGEQGATAVEYAIMAALIAVVVITGALALGAATNDELTCAGESLEDSVNKC